jgi:hypothetical protein
MPRFSKHLKLHLDDGREIVDRCGSDGEISHEANPCKLTSELTGTHRQGAARRMLPHSARGALAVRVRVEQPVRAHAPRSTG